MQIFHHCQSVREAISSARANGAKIGFVPTMGNLHRGHLALVRLAAEHCDAVVASIFVNRMQFGLNEDWDRYPRTLEQDIQKLETVPCDVLFCPDEQEIYPNGMDEQARVIVPTMSDILCGASRPGHFEGVTTVVAKLFNVVQPDVAVFGRKDFQQLAIIRRMVEDLCVPVKIVGADIEREDDGLAMSSRNSFIAPGERPKANQLHRSLEWIRAKLYDGNRAFKALEAEAAEQIRAAGFNVDYIRICESRSLEPAADDDNELTVLGAMYTEKARLIDNVSIALDDV